MSASRIQQLIWLGVPHKAGIMYGSEIVDQPSKPPGIPQFPVNIQFLFLDP